MVKYGPADSRSPCGRHIWETEVLVKPPRLWPGGPAPQVSNQRWRRPRVHPLPALSALSRGLFTGLCNSSVQWLMTTQRLTTCIIALILNWGLCLDGVEISMRAITFWLGFRSQKQLILISFVNHLAFRGAHLRICNAKECKTGWWTMIIHQKLKLIELSYWWSLFSLKSK